MRIYFLLLLTTILFPGVHHARIIHIGSTYSLTSPRQLQGIVVAGDTALIHTGIYSGTFFLTDFSGSASQPILIRAAAGENVIFQGGTESFHFSDISYVILDGLIIEKQTGNGMNIDDAGSFASPSHHILIKNCIFRNINASGNNDLLKLSGVDDFRIENCQFENGSTGGSGIDMVGCHRGEFYKNKFKNQGSNSIQIKGGTLNMIISQNEFVDGGARVLNIGGSTGLEFFRPLNATYEARWVQAFSNVFIGGETPFAFVGSIDCSVYNNTIIKPGKWAMRILQETVDISRFEPAGRDSIYNNIFYITSAVSTEVNIGPNTASPSFYYSNNLWYKENQPIWQGPSLPVKDNNQTIANPLLDLVNFRVGNQSPAIKKGRNIPSNTKDYYNLSFGAPPSIGAVEIASTVPIKFLSPASEKIKLYPSIANHVIHVSTPIHGTYDLIDIRGNKIMQGKLNTGENILKIEYLIPGIYIVRVRVDNRDQSLKWVKY